METLLDVPAGFARHDRKSPLNLTVDYVGAAQVGQWLEFDTVFVRAGGTLCFTQAFVTADGEPCARANAVFRAMGHRATRPSLTGL